MMRLANVNQGPFGRLFTPLTALDITQISRRFAALRPVTKACSSSSSQGSMHRGKLSEGKRPPNAVLINRQHMEKGRM